VQKNWIFRNFGVSAQTGAGLSQCEQERGVNFSRFCMDAFTSGPLPVNLFHLQT